MNYRPEIDGLRALAVVPVLLFHAGIPGFSGGFIGVDVFFVISGYLITAILLKDLERGKFSIVNFYERRARRILPALYVVVLTTIPLAWLVMMPSQLTDYFQSLVAVSAFAANLFFYLKSGYFEPASELSPLLHIWSLAVEEQFYFVFPVFLFLGYRFFRKGITPAIVLLSILSIIFAQRLLETDPAQSFFLPLSRAWELLIGALINFLPLRKKGDTRFAEAGSTIGFLLIIGSIFLLDEHSPFPGLLALPPTVGTLLIIYFSSSTSRVGKILSYSPVVAIGLMSYSIYLWHQPLFAFARINSLGEPSLYVFFVLILLSIGLAYLTWRFVERPFRNRERMPKRAVWITSFAVTALIFGIGLVGHLNNGFATIKYEEAGAAFQAFDARLLELRHERKAVWAETGEGSGSRFPDDEGSKNILILGDSRAEDLYISLMLNEDRFPGTAFRLQGLNETCFTGLNNPSMSSLGTCGREIEAFKRRISEQRIDAVVVSCGWQPGSTNQLKALLEYLGDIPCIVFGTASFNEINSQFFAISRRGIPQSEWPQFFTQNVHSTSRSASQKLAQLAEIEDFVFVDPYEFFEIPSEDSSGAPLYNITAPNGDPMIVDQTHLTAYAARNFGKFIADKGWIR